MPVERIDEPYRPVALGPEPEPVEEPTPDAAAPMTLGPLTVAEPVTLYYATVADFETYAAPFTITDQAELERILSRAEADVDRRSAGSSGT
jgi:hypothetical protein